VRVGLPFGAGGSRFGDDMLAAESAAWIRSYGISDPLHDYAGLAFLMFPLTVSRSRLRWLCDYFTWLFPIDDLLDRPALLGADPAAVQRIADNLNGVLDGGSGPWRHPFVAAFADLWRRIVPQLSQAQLTRLAGFCRDYGEGLVFMADQRRRGLVPPLADFLRMRRKESVADVCLMLVEYSLGIDVTAQLPELTQLHTVFAHYTIVTQDRLSYRKEQAEADLLNCIDSYRLEHGCGPVQAQLAVAAMEGRLRDEFTALTSRPVPEAERYPHACALFVAGYLNWTSRSARYQQRDRTA
jgi:hypothetical protein